MAGRKVFTAGEVLQAADVNDYLMDQSVMVFAGTAARGSAIPSPTEGMVTYTSDDDEVQVYDGSVWKAVGPGKILQVVSTTKADAFTTTSTSFTDVTGLSASITPTSASNKILVLVNLYSGYSTNGDVRFNLVRDSTNLGQPSFGTYPATAYSQPASSFDIRPISMSILDTPASTSVLTYKIQMVVFSDTGTVNRRGNDTVYSATSNITVMEVAG